MAQPRQYIVTIIFMFVCFAGWAQQKEYNNLFSFSFAGSFPVGDFGSKSSSVNGAAFANIGNGSQLSFSHDFSKRLGICAMVFSSSFEVDNAAAVKAIGASAPYSITATTGKWRTVDYMVGAYDLYLLKRTRRKTRVMLYDRAMIGCSYVTLPAMSVTGVTSGFVLQADQSSQHATPFCYMIGVGIRIQTNNRFSVAYGVDYFSTKPIFRDVTSSSSINGSTNSISTTVTQRISTIPVTVSLGYRL